MILLTQAITFIRSTRWAQFALAGLAVAVVALIFHLWLSGERKEAATKAVKIERQEQAAEIINRVERANNASEAIRRDPDARLAECLRNARNPEDC